MANEYTERNLRIDVVDLALVGEVFQLPLRSWELPDDQEDIFDRHIKAAKAGLNLLASGFDFLSENVGHFLGNGAGGGPIKVCQERGASSNRDTIEVTKGDEITVVVPLPERPGGSQVVLLERDKEGVTLPPCSASHSA
ncbi:hypothetical protein GGE65_008201 [Skermanella aerolata]|uniref:hypothetical protein n=1 Tax=Skermanella aerolata TaxID=393310 RepID=UPI003D1D9055